MNKKKFQVIFKLGLLLVVLGFLMPVSCNQNGFELSQMMRQMGKPGGSAWIVSYLIIIMFFSAVFGVVLLLVNKHSLPMDWGVFLTSCGSGLASFLLLRGNSSLNRRLMMKSANIGSYFILIGLFVGGVALILASMKAVNAKNHEPTGKYL